MFYMDTKEWKQAWDRATELGKEVGKLEQQAGIQEKVSDGYAGPLIPYGATDDGFSREEAAKANADWGSWKHRKLYFQIEDDALRLKLLRAYDKSHRAQQELRELEQKICRRELIKARQQEGSAPWASTGVFSMIAIAAAGTQFGLIGAIAASAGSAFIGWGYIQNGMKASRAAVQEHEGYLKDVEETAREAEDPLFTASEIASGKPDPKNPV